MDTYFLFTPTAWAESLQRSKIGRIFCWNPKNTKKTDDPQSEYCESSSSNNPIQCFNIVDMPDYLRFNPWILSGYRGPKLTTVESLQSLTYLHNETVNIFTHGAPILFVMFNFVNLFGSLPGCLFTYFHAISCLTPWCGSFIYHVMMNHKRGKKFYTKLLCWDMSGIWFTQTFGALTTISVSFAALEDSHRHLIIGFYLLLSVYALYKGITAKNTWQRMSSFVALVVIRVFAFIYRQNTSNEPLSGYHLMHVINQEALPILGAIISAARLPERFYPGQFDLIFNSHNIMHCLVVAGGIHMHLAFRQEIILAKTYNHF